MVKAAWLVAGNSKRWAHGVRFRSSDVGIGIGVWGSLQLLRTYLASSLSLSTDLHTHGMKARTSLPNIRLSDGDAKVEPSGFERQYRASVRFRTHLLSVRITCAPLRAILPETQKTPTRHR